MPFDHRPSLRSELVMLRPLAASDLPALFAVAAAPLIWKQHPAPDRHRQEQFEAFFAEALASGGTLVVIETATGRVIGSSRYHGYDPAGSVVEIGWTFLARSHWGGRYNRELKRLMLEHAFRFVDRVVFLVGHDNLRSQRAVEKIGARRVGSRPDASGNQSYLYEIRAIEFARRLGQPRIV